MLNINKSSVYVRCPAGEQVIVLLNIKELYTTSPKNKKSVTVIKTVYTNSREPLPSFVIALGKKIINSWVNKNLIGKEHICATNTSYINNTIVIKYLDHLIKYFYARLTKPWKILLLNRHESYYYKPF